MTVPGIGPLAASALEASDGNGHQFANARFFAAWLGLTPREHSTRGKSTLLGISKRGNTYPRTRFRCRLQRSTVDAASAASADTPHTMETCRWAETATDRRSSHIPHRVEDRPHIVLPLRAIFSAEQQIREHKRPFLIRHIAWITNATLQTHPSMLDRSNRPAKNLTMYRVHNRL
jgi:hypothetical protein